MKYIYLIFTTLFLQTLSAQLPPEDCPNSGGLLCDYNHQSCGCSSNTKDICYIIPPGPGDIEINITLTGIVGNCRQQQYLYGVIGANLWNKDASFISSIGSVYAGDTSTFTYNLNCRNKLDTFYIEFWVRNDESGHFDYDINFIPTPFIDSEPNNTSIEAVPLYEGYQEFGNIGFGHPYYGSGDRYDWYLLEVNQDGSINGQLDILSGSMSAYTLVFRNSILQTLPSYQTINGDTISFRLDCLLEGDSVYAIIDYPGVYSCGNYSLTWQTSSESYNSITGSLRRRGINVVNGHWTIASEGFNAEDSVIIHNLNPPPVNLTSTYYEFEDDLPTGEGFDYDIEKHLNDILFRSHNLNKKGCISQFDTIPTTLYLQLTAEMNTLINNPNLCINDLAQISDHLKELNGIYSEDEISTMLGIIWIVNKAYNQFLSDPELNDLISNISNFILERSKSLFTISKNLYQGKEVDFITNKYDALKISDDIGQYFFNKHLQSLIHNLNLEYLTQYIEPALLNDHNQLSKNFLNELTETIIYPLAIDFLKEIIYQKWISHINESCGSLTLPNTGGGIQEEFNATISYSNPTSTFRKTTDEVTFANNLFTSSTSVYDDYSEISSILAKAPQLRSLALLIKGISFTGHLINGKVLYDAFNAELNAPNEIISYCSNNGNSSLPTYNVPPSASSSHTSKRSGSSTNYTFARNQYEATLDSLQSLANNNDSTSIVQYLDQYFMVQDSFTRELFKHISPLLNRAETMDNMTTGFDTTFVKFYKKWSDLKLNQFIYNDYLFSYVSEFPIYSDSLGHLKDSIITSLAILESDYDQLLPVVMDSIPTTSSFLHLLDSDVYRLSKNELQIAARIINIGDNASSPSTVSLELDSVYSVTEPEIAIESLHPLEDTTLYFFVNLPYLSQSTIIPYIISFNDTINRKLNNIEYYILSDTYECDTLLASLHYNGEVQLDGLEISGDTVCSGDDINATAQINKTFLDSFGIETMLLVSGLTQISHTHSYDIDGDGDIDICASARGLNEVCWLEQESDTSFIKHTISTNALGAFDVYAIDIDNDGDGDVLSASLDDNKISWYENDGNQNFHEHTVTESSDFSLTVRAADLDGDTDIDILVGNNDGIFWFENNGSQQFSSHLIQSASQAFSIQLIDIDNDMDLDICAAFRGSGYFAWYENNGLAQFTENILGTTAGAINIDAGDIDGDGDIDFAGIGYSSGTSILYENNGSEQFSERVIHDDFFQPYDSYLQDADGDGDLDHVVVSLGQGKTYISYHIAFGIFSDIIEIYDGSAQTGIEMVNVSDPYHPQLLLSEYGAGTIRIIDLIPVPYEGIVHLYYQVDQETITKIDSLIVTNGQVNFSVPADFGGSHILRIAGLSTPLDCPVIYSNSAVFYTIPENLYISTFELDDSIFQASNIITSDGILPPGAQIILKSGYGIILNEGFEAPTSSQLLINIEVCDY